MLRKRGGIYRIGTELCSSLKVHLKMRDKNVNCARAYFSAVRTSDSRVCDHDDKPISEISRNVKELRNSIQKDEKVSMMIDALRGVNANHDDHQGEGLTMRLVGAAESSLRGNDQTLPLIYNSHELEKYFAARRGLIITRIWQVSRASAGFLFTLFGDYLRGELRDLEVKRAAELRNTIISLGPFFIKLGQALSIRPDLLSPRVMLELQQLCDKVPCFDSTLAMKIIEAELKKPINEIYSSISLEPIAAASLGQVLHTITYKNSSLSCIKHA